MSKSKLLLKAKVPKRKAKKSKLFMSKKQANAEASQRVDHESNLNSILGHSDHKKAIKDHNAGKHEHLSPRMKGAAFRSAMALHRHYKGRGGRMQ